MGIGDKLVGHPMAELLGVPLTAACEAQTKLAIEQHGFIQSITLDPAKIEEAKKTKSLEYKLQCQVADKDGKITTVDVQAQAPLFGLVPVPSLLIDDVNIKYQMEVSATEKIDEKTQAELDREAIQHRELQDEIRSKLEQLSIKTYKN
ncbi:MAG: DUF2589 domain-containing protein [Spirochaetaceae bacterium]|jgi:hypothetical protein|nr:DUF2589 domain-containing protein [Spirochaetaceae bacterium]